MKTFFLAILTSTLAWTCFAGEVPFISDLKPNERLEVQLDSSGCFHNSSEVFVFQGSTVSIFETERLVFGEKSQAITRLKKMGELSLSVDDVKKLDALMFFYASVPQGGCTTFDQITVKKFAGDKLIDTHEYADGSCSTYEMENVLTLNALFHRLSEQHKDKKAPVTPETP